MDSNLGRLVLEVNALTASLPGLQNVIIPREF